MTSPTHARERIARMTRLRRVLARPHPRRPAPPPSRPVVRRVWREVASGEWRWIHIDDQATSQ
jgi:hypothetical protein